MKKAFIITSAIEVDNDFPLTYSATRTHFASVDRFRHTTFTVACLDALAKEDSTFFIIDISDNYDQYKSVLSYQRNLVFVSVKEEFPEIHKTVKEHSNKSHCESLMLIKFFEKYKPVLEQYDYFFKISGRYFTDSSFDISICNEENLGKVFFKSPLKFDWIDGWNYQMVDRRHLQGENKLYQYCSVLYGFGREYLHKFIDIYRVMTVFTDHPNGIRYDVETLLYFFTRDFEADIVEVPWTVYGWDGTSGTFLRY